MCHLGHTHTQEMPVCLYASRARLMYVYALVYGFLNKKATSKPIHTPSIHSQASFTKKSFLYKTQSLLKNYTKRHAHAYILVRMEPNVSADISTSAGTRYNLKTCIPFRKASSSRGRCGPSSPTTSSKVISSLLEKDENHPKIDKLHLF